MNGGLRGALESFLRSHVVTMQEDGRVTRLGRFASPGEAANVAYDAVWAGPVGGTAEVWNGRHRLATVTKVAARAVKVTNHHYGSVQYRYNPDPSRPEERQCSPVWPPQTIPYREASETALV